jgi:hypothetical protein
VLAVLSRMQRGSRFSIGVIPRADQVEFIDIPWNGKSIDELELQVASQVLATLLDMAGSSLS